MTARMKGSYTSSRANTNIYKTSMNAAGGVAPT